MRRPAMNAATTSAAAAPMKNASAPKALRMRLRSVLSIANYGGGSGAKLVSGPSPRGLSGKTAICLQTVANSPSVSVATSGESMQRSKSAVPISRRRPGRATMLADLDLLLTAVFATADDLLPWRRRNARRSVTDAEVVTLAVAQAIMDIPSDREFLAVARARLCHLIPKLPKPPGYFDNVVLVDSTPVECGRSVDTARRSQLAVACAHHHSRSHSRWFWGMRLHLLAA